MNMNNCVIFVHPSMSVKMNFSLAKEYNYKIVSIITAFETSKIDIDLINDLSDYVFYSNNSVESDFGAILDLINTNQLKVDLIINGIDSSLYYADYLHNHLIGSPVLDLNLSKIRLNKYATNAYLLDKSLLIIPSVEITHKDELKTNKDKINNLGWPIIVKPSENTASMAGFSIAQDLDQLYHIIDDTLGKPNPYYQKCSMDKLILQKFISPEEHDEFAIDFLSCNGTHYLQGIAQYKKEILSNGTLINRQTKALVPSEVPGIINVIEYLKSILSELKVHYGITHNEVFWDRKSKIYLIETNNRMPGSGLVEQHRYCYGFNTLDSVLQLVSCNELPKLPEERVGHATIMKLYNYFEPNPNLINLKGLSSESKVITFYPDKYTPDLEITNYNRADFIAAHVLLTNKSQEALENDIEELLNRERLGVLFLKNK